MNIIQQLEKEQVEKLSAGKEIPDFGPGDTVVIDAENGEIVLLDVQTGEIRQKIAGQTGRILKLAFSPDGRTLATAKQTIQAAVFVPPAVPAQQVRENFLQEPALAKPAVQFAADQRTHRRLGAVWQR
mgnify:CR=1 FL=1